METGRAALGLWLAPRVLRGQKTQPPAETKTAAMPPVVAELERLIPKLMAEGGVPGVSIVLLQDAKPICRRAFGVKDTETGDAVDADTIFEAASVSKSVFAYLILKQCEHRVLNLDTPITRYTKLRPIEGDPRLDLITPRHVLCHTSGFQNWRSDANPLKLHFTPGEKFFYSGEGYSYLQSVVTELAAQPIEEVMRANLFQPLGMSASGYVWSETYAKRIARKHDRDGKPLPKPRPTAEDAARYAAAGALYSTPSDYAKFLSEILEPKPADRFRLTRESLAEMLRPHAKVDEASSWALGWKIQHTARGDLFQHHGGHKGAQVFASASRERKSGYVVMTNSDNGWKVFFNEVFVEVVNRFLLG